MVRCVDGICGWLVRARRVGVWWTFMVCLVEVRWCGEEWGVKAMLLEGRCMGVVVEMASGVG